MTEAEMNETLERTRCALAGHLSDIMDDVERNGGKIPSRRTLGGIHETLEAMYWLGAMPSKGAKAV